METIRLISEVGNMTTGGVQEGDQNKSMGQETEDEDQEECNILMK